jgi:hypothetical protein
MSGKSHPTREPREQVVFGIAFQIEMKITKTQGRRGGESESLEEEAIEIGNS